MPRRALLLLLTACTASTDGVNPSDCDADEVFTQECFECGPTDACLDLRDVCAPACEGDFTPCDDEGGVCVDGTCLHNLCG